MKKENEDLDKQICLNMNGTELKVISKASVCKMKKNSTL